MAMTFYLTDSTGAFSVGVTANNQLKVNLPTTIGQEGYVGIVDAGGHRMTFDDEGRVDTAANTALFSENVEGTTLDPNRWTTAATTQTVTQAAGFITLNASNILTLNTCSQITTNEYFDVMHEAYLYGHAQVLVTTAPVLNLTMELGFVIASSTTAPTDGAFFRWTAAGEFRCVLNNTGSETQISAALTAPTANVVHHYEVKVQHGHVDFIIDGVEIASLAAAAGIANAIGVGRLPFFARVVNGATAPLTAGQIKVAAVDIWRTVLATNFLYRDYQVSLGRGSLQNPSTWAQLANHANSTSPTSATLSNTAAGYTTLGGRWQFASPATAATDFALFGYQVPTGWQLAVHDIQITTVNTGAAVATTATILDWFVAAQSSAVSLATTDTLPSTVAPRRVPIGIQGFIIGAAIGAQGTTLSPHWEAGIICHGGRFFHIGVQVPLGTATASQVMRGDVFVSGYFS